MIHTTSVLKQWNKNIYEFIHTAANALQLDLTSTAAKSPSYGRMRPYGRRLRTPEVGFATLCPRRTTHIISRLADTGTPQPTYIISRSSVHMLILIGVLCSERKAVSELKVSFWHF